jgi:carbonic anhydrase/acetyltransferase-like protein (isoleucine patch superfamily)
MDGVSIISLNGKTPVIHPTAFVAPGCRLIGDIEIGPDSSIWYNCVLRADLNRIRIGARTNIQDGTVVHVDSPRGPDDAGLPTIIGDDVLIGHMAMVHGCVLEDRAFVGLGAIVMDGGYIESGGMLAAGAIMTPGKRIVAGEIWAGRPAKLLRMLSEAEQAGNRLGVAHYVENARQHRAAISG